MSALWEAQKQLQAEADHVVDDLELEDVLAAAGRLVRVGSSAMGLMVRRDIDITVICTRLDATALRQFAGIGAHLMQQPMVSAVRFRNDCGIWNAEPEKYPDGLYLGLTASAADGNTWTLDIWLVDDATRQPDLAHLETLLPRLTPERREAILQIKQVLADRHNNAHGVSSALVYEAVMEHGVQDMPQFHRWCDARAASRAG
jgi:hypothetical protein